MDPRLALTLGNLLPPPSPAGIPGMCHCAQLHQDILTSPYFSLPSLLVVCIPSLALASCTACLPWISQRAELKKGVPW